MALETDIYTAFWDATYSYRNSLLRYVRGWFMADMTAIPAGRLPAVCIYPTRIETEGREGGGDRFLLSLVVKGYQQHFDPTESVDSAIGREGILDLYHDLDRIIFTMLTQSEVTVDSVTTTVQTFPIFTDVDAVRDIIIGDVTFSTETYEDEYPNLIITIPVDIWYVKTDEVRRIT